jgi:hypothetical protein
MGEGRKDDKGKLPMHLLPFESLEDVSRVLQYGAERYGAHNWKLLPDAKARYSAALLRHISAHMRGEIVDPESGLSHLSHAACNALFLVYFEKEGI